MLCCMLLKLDNIPGQPFKNTYISSNDTCNFKINLQLPGWYVQFKKKEGKEALTKLKLEN